ncbi:nicotinate-nucleotide--dimethylbenzimidazole phosphoribosyltransferase [Rhizobium leguminosarum]|uniref:nicotinate-nucleotide--dimethylbenzimidazole phosphoribosyltransferase n=1 Tax=Rhizobium leguminosarum TaxID=384 RepID=UPI0039655BA7
MPLSPNFRRQSRCHQARHHALSANGDATEVENFAAGSAAINQICVAYDLGLKVFDLALDYPTGDITEEAALSERDCAATMAFGMEAMAGAILAARMERILVLIDGYVATAAAAILKAAIHPRSIIALIGHVSGEPGHLRAIEMLGKTPLLALGMRLGEGTGEALAAGIVKAAAACHSGMATFAQAGVTKKH